MMLVAVAATVLSGWDYFHRYSGAFNPRDTVPTGSGDE
jgi:hypothetical protein